MFSWKKKKNNNPFLVALLLSVLLGSVCGSHIKVDKEVAKVHVLVTHFEDCRGGQTLQSELGTHM